MPSSGADRRDELIRALNAAMAEVSGQGVLFSQAVAARLKINSTDLECLGVMFMRGPVSAGDLAKATALTTGAITGVIDRLERAGFARREPDPADRRKVLVRPTEAAERRISPLYEPMMREATAALQVYDADQLVFLLDFLRRAHAAGLAAMAELGTTEH